MCVCVCSRSPLHVLQDLEELQSGIRELRASLHLLNSTGGAAALQAAIDEVVKDSEASNLSQDEQLKSLENRRNALQSRLRNTISSCQEIRQVVRSVPPTASFSLCMFVCLLVSLLACFCLRHHALALTVFVQHFTTACFSCPSCSPSPWLARVTPPWARWYRRHFSTRMVSLSQQ